MTAKKAKTEMDPLTEKPEPFMGDAEGTGQPPALGDNARGCPVMGRRVLELKVQWARPGEARSDVLSGKEFRGAIFPAPSRRDAKYLTSRSK